MKSKLEQLLYTTADLIFEALVVVVYQILRFEWKLSKFISKLVWRSIKFTAWSTTKKNFWKGLVVVLPLTFSFVLVAITLPFFNPYKGGYINPVTKLYTRDEVLIIQLMRENKEKEQELKKYEGLKTGDKEAIRSYIYKKFGEAGNIAVAVFTAESGLRANAIGDGHLAFYVGDTEYGKSYGVAQIRHLQGRPSPKWLLDPKNNIDYAYSMYQRQGGFQAWSAYTNGKYLSSL